MVKKVRKHSQAPIKLKSMATRPNIEKPKICLSKVPGPEKKEDLGPTVIDLDEGIILE